MNIKVFNENDIQKFITAEKHIVISFQDPNHPFIELSDQMSRIDELFIHCYDLDEDTGIFPYSKFIFKPKDAKNILDFVYKHKDSVSLICVNCVAGISRSAGCAAALSKILIYDDSYFFKKYLPNMLIYRTILVENNERH